MLHVPAYALGHIQASCSGIRSTRHALDTTTIATDPIATESRIEAPPISDNIISEYLAAYNELEYPSIQLLATIHPSSKFRDCALFSDLAGRFPVTAFDGSQYIMISQYKAYIHVEVLQSRSETNLCNAFTRTYFFKERGHQIKYQVLDNECPTSLLKLLQKQQVTAQPVPPNQKRTNKAERAIQTFRNHFLSVLAHTPQFSHRPVAQLTAPNGSHPEYAPRLAT
jgi:hypothetical protein